MLVRQKLLVSQKGPNGGFYLSTNPEQLTLLKVVELVDGLEIFDRCGIGMKQCSDKYPCPIHNEYKLVKSKIRELLTNKTLAELGKDVQNGKSIVAFVS